MNEKNYSESLTKQDKLKLLGLLSLIGTTGKIQNKEKFRNEGSQIYAFKPHPNRFLCFFYRDKKIIITNAFEKKSDKLPPREKERALSCKQSYEDRVRKGNYYE